VSLSYTAARIYWCEAVVWVWRQAVELRLVWSLGIALTRPHVANVNVSACERVAIRLATAAGDAPTRQVAVVGGAFWRSIVVERAS
jgi:hypothetical protein